MRRFRIVHALGHRLWIIPSLGVVAGVLLSVVTVAIDRRNENGLLSQSIVGNSTDAQSILTTIATAVVTLTSMVLTVTLVAVQLAMGQFSPRIVRALLGDRGDQFAIAIFGATFTFAIFSLRAIDTGAGGGWSRARPFVRLPMRARWATRFRSEATERALPRTTLDRRAAEHYCAGSRSHQARTATQNATICGDWRQPDSRSCEIGRRPGIRLGSER